MKKRFAAILTLLFIIGDLALFNAAIAFSYWVLGIPFLSQDLSNSIYLFIFSNVGWLFLILVTNPYNTTSTRREAVMLQSHFSFLFVHLIVVISLIFFFDKRYDFRQLALLYLFFLPVVFCWRLLFFYFIRRLIQGRINDINFIVVGHSEVADGIRELYSLHPEYGYKFLRTFDVSSSDELNSKPADGLEEYCVEHNVHEIYWCLPKASDAKLQALINFCLNNFIKIRIVSDNREEFQTGISLLSQPEVSIPNFALIPLDDSKNQAVKRVFDIVFATGVALFVMSWLVPLIALLIKLDSKGPIFFRQKRAGKGNKPFYCIKFRTMRTANDKRFVQATRDDPRVTGIGKFLRKSSLDEFPQFFNVLIGDMSVVGPRPHPIELNENFVSRVEKLMSRHYIKPGVTGLAQCMGYRGETSTVSDMKNRVTLDRFYVENWSLLFDIRIIVKTVVSLAGSEQKAY
jgi:putative colanic acid biosynthesis UDP-glucose lipid carrier transferase